jgi:hypothetical protein
MATIQHLDRRRSRWRDPPTGGPGRRVELGPVGHGALVQVLPAAWSYSSRAEANTPGPVRQRLEVDVRGVPVDGVGLPL